MPSHFDETQWSLIDRVLHDDSIETRAALNELLHIYMPALQAYLVRRKHIPEQEAQDLLHEFIVNRILEKDLLRRSDRSKGRFRSLLLTALNRFLIDNNRYQNAQVRKDALLVGAKAIGETDPQDQQEQVDAFDATWARTVLRESLTSMWTECRIGQKEHVWLIFCQRILTPLLTGKNPPPYEAFVGRPKLSDVRAAQNAMVTAKRMLQRCVRSIVGEYAGAADIEDEIDSLYKVLSRSQGHSDDILSPALRDYLQLEHLSSMPGTHGTDHSQVAQLLQIAPEQERAASVSDPSAALDTTLLTPLATLLNWTDRDSRNSIWYDATLEQLFRHPKPPLDLLRQTKNLGRKWTSHSDIESLRATGAVIYFLSIAIAEMRCGERISRSGNDKLDRGIGILLQHSFIPTDYRATLQHYQRQLNS